MTENFWHGPRFGRWGGWRNWNAPVRVVSYPTAYPVYVSGQTSEYGDCVYAAGSCKDRMRTEFGRSVENPNDLCRQQNAQDFVRSLPPECRPSSENYNYKAKYTGAAIGVL